MAWVATAIVGTAVVGGIVQSNAASSAAKSQARANDASLAAAERQYYNDVALAAEMRQALLGLNPVERLQYQDDLDKATAKLTSENADEVKAAQLEIAQLNARLNQTGLVNTRYGEAGSAIERSMQATVTGTQGSTAARLAGIGNARETINAGIGNARETTNAGFDAAADVNAMSRRSTLGAYRTANNYTNALAAEIEGQYDNWNNVFGSMINNLGEFYNSLTPQQLSAGNLQFQQREYQTAVETVRKNFAQRGVAGGAQQAIESGMAMDNARARADIRAKAPFQVAEAKTGFLTSGAASLRNAYTDDLSQVRANQANLAISQAEAMNKLRAEQADLAVKRAGAVASIDLAAGNVASLDLAAGNVVGAGIDAEAAARSGYEQQMADLSLARLGTEATVLSNEATRTQAAGQSFTSAQRTNAINQGNIQANLATQQGNIISGVLNTGLNAGLYAYGGGVSQPRTGGSAPVYDGFTGQRVM